MSEANRLFQRQYGTLFANLRFERACLVGCSYGGLPAFTGNESVLSVTPKAAEKDDTPILVSFFRDAQNKTHCVFVNLHRTETRNVKVAFAAGIVPKAKTWDGWREKRPSADAGVANAVGEHGTGSGSLWLHLAAGHMEVIKL